MKKEKIIEVKPMFKTGLEKTRQMKSKGIAEIEWGAGGFSLTSSEISGTKGTVKDVIDSASGKIIKHKRVNDGGIFYVKNLDKNRFIGIVEGRIELPWLDFDSEYDFIRTCHIKLDGKNIELRRGYGGVIEPF